MKKWQLWPKNVITQIFQRPYNLFSILVQRDLSSGDSDSDETLSLDENDFNDDEENIESVIAKKRQVVHKRRIRGNPSQDNEDLR